MKSESRQVLIVDDDASARYMARVAIEQIGCQASEAACPQSALELCQQTHFDAVLLDVNMPGSNGLDACQKIRNIPSMKDTPIVIVTGLDEVKCIDEAYRVGATDFIIKPINWEILSHRVNHIIRASDAEKEIKYLAYYDSLTGLPNRASFDDILQLAIKSAEQEQKQLAVLFLDLDNFKRANDVFGHDSGDGLLKKIAEQITQVLRSSDLVLHDDVKEQVGRLGGDEFIILLKNDISIDGVTQVAKRLNKALSEAHIIDDFEIPLSVSIGAAIYPQDGLDSSALIKHADIAMYHAKASGKNGFNFYNEAMNEQAFYNMKLETDLKKALAKNQLYIEYQPCISPHTQKVETVEALVRWRHPELGCINPEEFIPLAEETGLISEIGQWVALEACKQAKKWIDIGCHDVSVSVNLSGRQFREASLVDSLRDILQASGLPFHLLNIEITEGVLMDDNARTLQVLHALKNLGVGLSVDDFGTGYSSLRYLSQFPIDALKIDKSFVENLETNTTNQVIIDAIVALAHGLKLAVVVEGVETETQLQIILEKQCDIIQGYYFSKPISSEALMNVLRTS